MFVVTAARGGPSGGLVDGGELQNPWRGKEGDVVCLPFLGNIPSLMTPLKPCTLSLFIRRYLSTPIWMGSLITRSRALALCYQFQ